jgi:hypothetical protein
MQFISSKYHESVRKVLSSSFGRKMSFPSRFFCVIL